MEQVIASETVGVLKVAAVILVSPRERDGHGQPNRSLNSRIVWSSPTRLDWRFEARLRDAVKTLSVPMLTPQPSRILPQVKSNVNARRPDRRMALA